MKESSDAERMDEELQNDHTTRARRRVRGQVSAGFLIQFQKPISILEFLPSTHTSCRIRSDR
jgi:hypothetical protein